MTIKQEAWEEGCDGGGSKMTNEQEQKWREEAIEFAERNEVDFLRPIAVKAYLAAKQSDPVIINAQAKEIEEKQAEIDRLMLEFCPDEMTTEQKENREKHQRVCTSEEQSEIEEAIRAKGN